MPCEEKCFLTPPLQFCTPSVYDLSTGLTNFKRKPREPGPWSWFLAALQVVGIIGIIMIITIDVWRVDVEALLSSATQIKGNKRSAQEALKCLGGMRGMLQPIGRNEFVALWSVAHWHMEHTSTYIRTYVAYYIDLGLDFLQRNNESAC